MTQFCLAGRSVMSPISTSSGCSMAKAIARATASEVARAELSRSNGAIADLKLRGVAKAAGVGQGTRTRW